MRSSRWMILVVLVGCGNSGHDGPAGGSGGGPGPDSGVSDKSTAGTTANAGGAGQSGAHGGNGAQVSAGHSAAGGGSGHGSEALQIPRVYPLVRAGTPASLIADDAFRATDDPSLDMFGDDAGTSTDSSSLGHVVQDRIYTAGPTELLRIVSELDGRTGTLDTDPSRHACLTAAPVGRTLMFPGGQSFGVQLQCLSEWPGGWFAFGWASSNESGDDAGADAVSRNDFYLVEGQDGGMGGAYRIRGGSKDVEGWITVADSRVPNNSQVIMHLWVDAGAATTELAFGGSGVGFCSAHLKTGSDHIFIRGKTNAPPPPGAPNGQYCDSEHTGCFSTSDLNMDLGAAAVSCDSISASSFAIQTTLDASSDPEANVTPAIVYQFFNSEPQGIQAF
jgi:hypothetical protein